MATSGAAIGGALGTAAGAYFGGPAGAGIGYGIGSSFGSMFDEPGGEHPTGKPLAIYDQIMLQDKLQREYAQSGIQWRVEDARAAGLHPVFALSGGGAAFASPSLAIDPVTKTGRDFAGMGQNLQRAVDAASFEDDRTTRHLQQRLLLAQIENQEIENANKRRGVQAQVGPGLGSSAVSGDPVIGSGQATVKPDQMVSADDVDRSITAGSFSPALKRYSYLDADGRESVAYLPEANSFGESLEPLSESFALAYGIFKENMRRDPQFIYKIRHLLPFGEEMFHYGEPVARGLERAAQWYLNASKARQALEKDYRIWNRAGRERGVNWKGRGN